MGHILWPILYGISINYIRGFKLYKKRLMFKIKVPMVISVVDFVIIKLKSLQLLDQVHEMQHDLMHWMAMVNFSYVFKIWQWIALPIGYIVHWMVSNVTLSSLSSRTR